MSMTDPVADMLTKIRNASCSKFSAVDVRASHLAQRIVDVLKQEGFIRSYKLMGQSPHQQLRVYLKYAPDKTPAITTIRRVSKPGQRRYGKAHALPRVFGGLGRIILTTSKGVMTDVEAKRQHLGGELLCYVW